MHRVVIVGGGFGGLAAARALKGLPVEVALLDRRNFHLFQPLLYQVATGDLSPANIATPLRVILRSARNCSVFLAEVTGFDVASRVVEAGVERFPYDTLILAAGAGHSYFGNDHWESYAPGLKTIEDATEIRKRLLTAFEAAELADDPEKIREYLTFVVIGGGPTGIEVAGALSEIAYHTLTHDFRRINPAAARIIIIEAAPHPLSVYPEDLSAKATESLHRLGVEVMAKSRVTAIEPDHVVVQQGDEHQQIRTRTVIWAAGVAASPLGKRLAAATNATTDRVGRIQVQPDLTLPNHPEIMVIGDLAHCAGADGKPLPGLAPVAVQQGRYAAAAIAGRLRGQTPPPFRYSDWGSMAVIGRFSAVAMVGKRKLSGFLAWLAWLFIHLMLITQFRNRVLVLIQWGWAFLTRDRSARLITNIDSAAVPKRPLPMAEAPSSSNDSRAGTPSNRSATATTGK